MLSSIRPTTLMPGHETIAGDVSLNNVSKVLCIIFGILGLLGNGLVLVVMVRVRSLRTITNLFIANQSIIDFLTSIFLLTLLYKPPCRIRLFWLGTQRLDHVCLQNMAVAVYFLVFDERINCKSDFTNIGTLDCGGVSNRLPKSCYLEKSDGNCVCAVGLWICF